jgi:hypothetical protein
MATGWCGFDGCLHEFLYGWFVICLCDGVAEAEKAWAALED